MPDYLERYAEPAGGESVLPPRITNIPHHFVFDCSARFFDTSVNDKFFTRP